MNGDVVLAVGFALISALGFALSTSLQHRVAGGSPGGGILGVLRFVIAHPVWLLGAAIGFVSLLFHALALNKGAIALVQPIMISGVVMAVVFRAALDRTWPPRAELIAVSLTTAALGIFVVVADPTAESTWRETVALVFWLVGLSLVGLLVAVATRLRDPMVASWLMGVASGGCFGMTAGMLKLLSHDFGGHGVMGILTSWHLLAQVLTGLLGVAINQRAYHLAPLSVSMPVLNVVSVLVALTFGVLVFHEIPATHPAGISALCGCMVVMFVGLRMLASVHQDRGSVEGAEALTGAAPGDLPAGVRAENGGAP